jgi:hypothetical protein
MTPLTMSEPSVETVYPLPENAAKVRAAYIPPHPMQGRDPFEHKQEQKRAMPSAPEKWPEPMSQAAFHGLAGEFVQLVLSETEADPAALLLAFLAAVGCMMGREPHYRVEATRHGVNLFTVIVGETSKSRKGTATDRVVDILQRADSDFIKRRLSSGLSSGEGLIQAVRDPREEDVPTKTREGTTVGFARQLVDAGEPDKRLLVVESEFASVLQQTGREGNILSAVLRDTWDGRPLRILARSNKDCCLKPHISMIGNITSEELQRLLTSNDRANGFGNRILWCCSRRSQLLPFGGRMIDDGELDAFACRVRDAVQAASEPGRVVFDSDARPAWENLYYTLAEGATGLFGSMTARSEAQVVRLATLYALLDGSRLIGLPHLEAAQEVWGYCEESVRYLFGDASGDETADTIVKLLGKAPGGMTQTEINRGLSGHKSAAELTRALKFLEGKGKARCEREPTGGMSSTRWHLSA